MGRRLHVGAEVTADEPGVHFRVWAPRRHDVAVVVEGGPGAGAEVPLAGEEAGYFSGSAAAAAPGTLYRFRLDGEERLFPDPASRFQPDGPDGPSEVIDPHAFQWSDAGHPGCALAGQVIYELHVGTFTRDGTWRAAAAELSRLEELGVTLIEMMPVADWPGRFGWGYDGVDLFAPTHNYGRPDDLRAFVDRAHALGLGVILDVVYNHLGPRGNYLSEFSADYFSRQAPTEWGDALNFDGPQAEEVRAFYLANAGYWIDEYHLDGLRLDATQSIHDRSAEHVIQALARQARASAGGRRIVIVGENEPQEIHLARPPEEGGFGLDALWNDDFHHSAMVALTGKSEAYYSDYKGSAQELVSAVRWGFLYQGQRSTWQREKRGSPALGEPAQRFVNFLQNHDQVSNSAWGLRLTELTTPGRLRAMTALLLLGPATPMLFMGQEYGARTPFLYFADHDGELADQVRSGRRSFMSQFRSVAEEEMATHLANPADARTFERSKLDPAERAHGRRTEELHRDLLRLRRDDPVFARQDAHRVHGAVLAAELLVLRFLGEAFDDRLLLVNLGRDRLLEAVPEPLLAPPERGAHWAVLWSSEDPRYGGGGTASPERREVSTRVAQARAHEEPTRDSWRVPAHAAVVLKARRRG